MLAEISIFRFSPILSSYTPPSTIHVLIWMHHVKGIVNLIACAILVSSQFRLNSLFSRIMAGKRRFHFPSGEEVTILVASVVLEWPFHMVCGSLDKWNVFSCPSRSFDAGGETLLMLMLKAESFDWKVDINHSPISGGQNLLLFYYNLMILMVEPLFQKYLQR